MNFNNLRCRRAQCIFKTFNRFFYSFYFQIIICRPAPHELALLSNNVYLPEQSKYLRYIQLSDNEALHRHSTYRGPRVDRIPP